MKLIKNLPDPVRLRDVPAEIEEKKALLLLYLPLVEAVANTVKIFTGAKADKKIDEALAVIRDLLDTNGNPHALESAKNRARLLWPTFRPYLKWAKLITGRKGDRIIDLVIYLVDDILDIDE